MTTETNIIEDKPDDEDRATAAVDDSNISFEHTMSTIHSLAEEEPSRDTTTIFDTVHGDAFKRKRRTANSTLNETTQSSSTKRKKKSVLHTYPVHHTSATETSMKLTQALKKIYKTHVLPIEQRFALYDFCLPTNAEIQDSEFDAKPMVLLLGQYSTGKTTFIRHLIGRDFPAMHIGPEPTTDRFMALCHGEDENTDDFDNDLISLFSDHDSFSGNVNFPSKAWMKDGQNKSTGRIIKGNSLTVVPELPFSTLATFGSGFLSHFVGSISSAPLLQHVTLIDTPGVLSGEKQRLSRSYDFAQAAKWFADRSDLILLLFDAHKLDISDELKDVIEVIRPNNDDKMRCILNKADAVTREQLVRVYGSLMWSMGKIFRSPEVVRVYTGSYWEQDLIHEDFKGMFEKDEFLLINELVNLPKSCAERKVNELVKRIRIIKVHLCILTYLKNNTPTWFGKKKAMERMMENLEDVFDAVRLEYKLSAGDFPDIDEFRECLEDLDDFSDLIAADKWTLRKLDNLIVKEIPAIMRGVTGLNFPGAPVRTINTTKPKNSSRVVEDSREEAELDLSHEEKTLDNISMANNDFEPNKMRPLHTLLLAAGIYILCYIAVIHELEFGISLPVFAQRHFLLVEKFFKTHVFDTFPSGEALI